MADSDRTVALRATPVDVASRVEVDRICGERLVRVNGIRSRPTCGRCGCREGCPSWSCGVFVFVEDAAESVTPADGEVRDLVQVSDRFG